jgi:hypothetical protein
MFFDKKNLNNFYKLTSFIFVLCSFLLACRTDKKNTEIQLSGTQKVFLLDSIAASNALVKDDIEKFFDKIQPVDMMIQMKKSYDSTANREVILSDYKVFIQHDVESFTAKESEFLAKVMSEAYTLSNSLSTKIFPEEIRLVKTKGKHYGDDTYYTRENLIIIPKAALVKPNYEEFLKVMLHEISHIYTRLHPSIKAELYAAIGFKHIAQKLDINDSLRQRILMNPDGIDENWATVLTLDGGKEAFAVPIIYANEFVFKKEKQDFFQYLGWNYYEITPSVSGNKLAVQTIGKMQKSTLSTVGINQLFKDKFNTDYIIHPDEIIADNFAITLLSHKNPKILLPLTEGGRKLIETIKGVLMK